MLVNFVDTPDTVLSGQLPADIAHVDGLLVRLHHPLPAEALAALVAAERLDLVVLGHVNLNKNVNCHYEYRCLNNNFYKCNFDCRNLDYNNKSRRYKHSQLSWVVIGATLTLT